MHQRFEHAAADGARLVGYRKTVRGVPAGINIAKLDASSERDTGGNQPADNPRNDRNNRDARNRTNNSTRRNSRAYINDRFKSAIDGRAQDAFLAEPLHGCGCAGVGFGAAGVVDTSQVVAPICSDYRVSIYAGDEPRPKRNHDRASTMRVPRWLWP